MYRIAVNFYDGGKLPERHTWETHMGMLFFTSCVDVLMVMLTIVAIMT